MRRQFLSLPLCCCRHCSLCVLCSPLRSSAARWCGEKGDRTRDASRRVSCGEILEMSPACHPAMKPFALLLGSLRASFALSVLIAQCLIEFEYRYSLRFSFEPTFLSQQLDFSKCTVFPFDSTLEFQKMQHILPFRFDVASGCVLS